jgi:phage-related protein
VRELGEVVSYQAKYYRDRNEREPVSDAIDTLGETCQESVDHRIGLLNRLDSSNPDLPSPYSSAIKNPKYRGFRELRAECGKTHHRILFRRSDNLFILLHIILNKTDDIPEGDLKIAKARWDDFKDRMDAVPTKKPRAMGRDAPRPAKGPLNSVA